MASTQAVLRPLPELLPGSAPGKTGAGGYQRPEDEECGIVNPEAMAWWIASVIIGGPLVIFNVPLRDERGRFVSCKRLAAGVLAGVALLALVLAGAFAAADEADQRARDYDQAIATRNAGS